MSKVKDGQLVEEVTVAGAKYSLDEGAALLLIFCCCFTKNKVTGIAIKRSNKFPRMKNLFVNIFI